MFPAWAVVHKCPLCTYFLLGRRSERLSRRLVLFFFSVSKVGLPLMGYTAVQYTDCYSEPMSTRLLNSISSRIYRENTQFNMYTTTSKQQEGCTFKDSHPKCFITTNFDKFHCEAFARGGESRWCFDSMLPWYTKSIRMAFVLFKTRAWVLYQI